MTLNDAITQIQLTYPQVYYACHTTHRRARSSAHGLSARDLSILVHLDTTRPTTLSDLARHLNLAASTVSEAISVMVRLGHVAKTRSAGQRGGTDRRTVGLTLTPLGLSAVRAESVLETARLRRVLRHLTSTERERAIGGLQLLADACHRAAQATDDQPRRPS